MFSRMYLDIYTLIQIIQRHDWIFPWDKYKNRATLLRHLLKSLYAVSISVVWYTFNLPQWQLHTTFTEKQEKNWVDILLNWYNDSSFKYSLMSGCAVFFFLSILKFPVSTSVFRVDGSLAHAFEHCGHLFLMRTWWSTILKVVWGH